MLLNKRIAFWGSNFDPNPDIGSVRKKLTRFIQSQGDRVDYGPYDILEQGAYENRKLLEKLRFRFAGKHPCPKWLSTAPDFSRELYPEMYRSYIDEGECKKFVYDFGCFVTKGTEAGEIPVVIGVDHCLTGGIIKCLLEKNKDLVVIVFDKHLDAIPPALRNQLVGYMTESNTNKNNTALEYEYYGNSFVGNYDTGSFLYYLIKEDILHGDNLIVMGTQDAPGENLYSIKDKRVSQYLETYQSLKDEGVIIKTLSELENPNIKNNLDDIKKRLEGKQVYLSVDIDVFKGKFGQSTRYGDGHGLSYSKFFKLLQCCCLGNTRLVGMDLMELDVNAFALNAINEKEAVSFFVNTIVETCKIL